MNTKMICPECRSLNIEPTYSDGGELNLYNLRLKGDNTFTGTIEMGCYCLDCDADFTIYFDCDIIPKEAV